VKIDPCSFFRISLFVASARTTISRLWYEPPSPLSELTSGALSRIDASAYGSVHRAVSPSDLAGEVPPPQQPTEPLAPDIVVTGRKCEGGTWVSGGLGDVCVIGTLQFDGATGPFDGPLAGGGGGNVITVTGTRPQRLSRCMQNFLHSQGVSSPVLDKIRFIRGMDDGLIANAARRNERFGAITLGRNIYVRSSRWQDITNPLAGPT
jgi:hypothetical protein